MSFILKSYLKLIKILIFLFPLFLISGPFFPDLFCIFIGLSYLFIYFKNDKFEQSEKNIGIFFILFYLYLNINSFLSFDIITSLKSSLPIVRIFIFIFALRFFFYTQKNIVTKLYVFFILCLTFLFIDSIYQFINNINLIGLVPASEDRITSFFGSEQIMGSYIMRLIPCILGLSFLTKIKRIEDINFLILLAASVLVFLSGERLALAYLIIFLAMYFFIIFDKKKIIYFLIVISIIISSLSMISPNQAKKFIVNTYNQIADKKTFFTSYRHLLHYRTAYSMFLEKPLIGHGLKSFRFLCSNTKYFDEEKILEENTFISLYDGIFTTRLENKNFLDNYIVSIIDNDGTLYDLIAYNNKTNLFVSKFQDGDVVKKGEILYQTYEYKNGCNTHPHNIPLQFLSELGLIGLIFLLTIFVYVLYNLYALTKKKLSNKFNNIDKAKFLILSGILITIIPVFPSGNYFNNWLMIISYYPIGIYLYLLKLEMNNEK
jgi:O-antigen ligase